MICMDSIKFNERKSHVSEHGREMFSVQLLVEIFRIISVKRVAPGRFQLLYKGRFFLKEFQDVSLKWMSASGKLTRHPDHAVSCDYF